MQSPNHTQVPNIFIDELQRGVNDPAVRCFLVICRKTIGWHKETDSVSIRQIKRLTGLSNNGVLSGIESLEMAKLVIADRSPGKSTRYTVNFETVLPERTVCSPPGNSSVLPERTTKETLKETPQKKEEQPAAPAVVESAQEKLEKLHRAFEDATREGNLQRMVLLGMELVRGMPFSNYPKEQKAAARLAEKIRKLSNGQEPRAFLHALVAAFKHKKESSRSEYWREAPYTPSDLETRFEGVYEHMRKRAADHQDGQENRELLERLNL